MKCKVAWFGVILRSPGSDSAMLAIDAQLQKGKYTKPPPSNSLTIQNGFLFPYVADWKNHMYKKLNFTSEGPELQNLLHDENAFLLLQSLKNCSFRCSCLDLHIMKFAFNNHLLRYQPRIHLCFPSLSPISYYSVLKCENMRLHNTAILTAHFHRENLLKHPFGGFI